MNFWSRIGRNEIAYNDLTYFIYLQLQLYKCVNNDAAIKAQMGSRKASIVQIRNTDAIH